MQNHQKETGSLSERHRQGRRVSQQEDIPIEVEGSDCQVPRAKQVNRSAIGEQESLEGCFAGFGDIRVIDISRDVGVL